MRLEMPSSQSCERDKSVSKSPGQRRERLEVLAVAKVTALRIRCESRRIVLAARDTAKRRTLGNEEPEQNVARHGACSDNEDMNH